MKLKHDIFGIIERFFWSIYTHTEHLEGVDITRRQMIACDIIVKINNNIAGYHLVIRRVISTPSDVKYVYKYPKTFGKSLEHDTCVVKKGL